MDILVIVKWDLQELEHLFLRAVALEEVLIATLLCLSSSLDIGEWIRCMT